MSTLPDAPQVAASSAFAVELLAEFVRRGVRHIIVCPGSRSQALALAAAQAEQAGAISLHVRLDERSAGFFALGIAQESGIPAPVIVTSGTAVANLLPAALEAHEARVPFIAFTADRPAELHGIRSNQTTRQAHIFGSAARLSLNVPAPIWQGDGTLMRDKAYDPSILATRALAASTGVAREAPPGPVQLNLAFTEPLSGTSGADQMIISGFRAAGEEGASVRASGVRGITDPDILVAPNGCRTRQVFTEAETYEHNTHSVPTVVIAGAGAGEAAAEFAHQAGLPLFAEVVSGARYGREALTCHAALLDTHHPDTCHLVQRIQRVIVFGHPTLTRQVPELLKQPGVETIVVDLYAGGTDTMFDHYDPGRNSRIVRACRIAADYDLRGSTAWLRTWLDADEECNVQHQFKTPQQSITRDTLARFVWSATTSNDRLMLSASHLVRVLNEVAPAHRIRVHANRGLAGIDGTLATALGVARASQDPSAPSGGSEGITRVLIGDLATLHDASSLLLPEAETQPRIQVIVGNDGGGTIFDRLEVAKSSAPEHYDRVMYTPQKVRLDLLAAAYGWEYRTIDTADTLGSVLAQETGRATLIEVPLNRSSAPELCPVRS